VLEQIDVVFESGDLDLHPSAHRPGAPGRTT
jgi:hypothetical protein